MFKLPDLPFDYNALEPVISDRTMHFHHDKHEATYVKTLNELLEKAGKNPDSLEDAVKDAWRAGEKKLFNNAAQAWNHAFFWQSMSPKKAKPAGELSTAIEAAFSDLEGLKQAFVTEGIGHFGSGWVWLASDRGGALKVVSTHDGEDLLTQTDLTPLLTCDLWEHAYYLDHQNNRKGFLEAWFDGLANWEFAGFQYTAVKGGGAHPWRYPSSESEAKQAKAG
ncbi:MAG TPA: superoxide dismutase [Caulobacteraceae bacterium]|jgi:Fe-Mn family superoxide dismutase|nr:superoxide dismutase [Caulobacteraceae bacterium]